MVQCGEAAQGRVWERGASLLERDPPLGNF